jgi:hypothetical protein
VDVANVPFLVEKLKVQVLPCLVCFVDGVTKDRFVVSQPPLPSFNVLYKPDLGGLPRLIGFEELGNNDNFSTASLEIRLKQSGERDSPPDCRVHEAEYRLNVLPKQAQLWTIRRRTHPNRHRFGDRALVRQMRTISTSTTR